MPFDNPLYAKLRKSSPGELIAKAVRTIDHSFGDAVVGIQDRLNLEPTLLRTSAAALRQWRYALRDVPEPNLETIGIAALVSLKWVEWAVYSACYLVKMGYRPQIIYSTKRLCEAYGDGGLNPSSFWSQARKLPHIDFLDLDQLFPSSNNDCSEFDTFADTASHTAAAYELGVEEFEPSQSSRYNETVETWKDLLKSYAYATRLLRDSTQATRVICPSGLIGESLAIREVLNESSIKTVFVEGFLPSGHLIWNFDQPALEYDVEGWFSALGTWSAEQEQHASDYMKFREGLKTNEKFDRFHQVQRAGKQANVPQRISDLAERSKTVFLLGTNIVGDSATLQRATMFRSQADWIRQVVAYFRERPDLGLVIRSHPDEVWIDANVRLGSVARIAAEDAPNIEIIHAEEKANTYSIAELSDCGLAWVSNIGLDMAIRGKPVVIAAKAGYAGLGICYEPRTVPEYFSTLDSLAKRPQGPSAEAIQKGKQYHHAVFSMMSLDADVPSYLARELRLDDEAFRGERLKFYRILVGELGEKGQRIDEDELS